MSVQPETKTAPWTMARLLLWATDHLARHDVPDGRLATEVLLARAVGCRRIDLYTRFEQTLSDEALGRFRGWLRRAAAGEPIAYLVGEKEFFSLPFFVSDAVLIPRPETEVLVQCIIDHFSEIERAQPMLLDVGTGTGCIAITVLTQLGDARAVASDLSTDALDVARSNADRHDVSDRITLVEADRLAISTEAVPGGGFDVIASNPPYVATDRVDQIDRNVRKYEPAQAVSDGGDGLSFYRSIAADGPALLSSDGAVFVEIDEGQAAPVIETMEHTGEFAHRKTWRDRVVGHERVLMFSRGRTS